MKKRSAIYEFLWFFVSIAHRLFYKEIIVDGRENIPKKGALIFAPNHQNALMDALAVIFTNGRMTIFLARADIFKKRFLYMLLTILKILPAYRQRDGRSSLEKNDITFNKAIEILEYERALCLFPETQHTNKRRLQQLKKGVQRIAFLAKERSQSSLDIKIIPVGLYYSEYPVSRSVLQVNYGKAVNVDDYFELYKENEQKAMLELRDELTRRIKPLIIDIQNPDFYEMYESLREIYFRNVLEKMKLKKCQGNKFIADKIIIESLDKYTYGHIEEVSELNSKVITYEKLIKSEGLVDECFSGQQSTVLLLFLSLFLILLSPLFLITFMINVIPLKIAENLVKNIKDKQFHSSFKFGIGILLFPAWYLILSGILFLLSNFTFFNICFIIIIWITLYIYFKFRETYNFVLKVRKYFKLKSKKPELFNEIVILRNEIIQKMNEVIK